MMVKSTTYAASVAFLLSTALAQQVVMYTPGGDDTSVQRIDPILAPGKISQHVHQVFGANKLSSDMSYESLQQSDCSTVGSADFQGNGQDHSVYWHPALFMETKDGSGYIRVPTNGHKLYYLDIGTGNKAEPFEFPHGFRMLAGDPFLRGPASNTDITLWKCSTGGSYNVGESGGFPTGVSTCSDYPYFYGSVEFPHCWNGDDFNEADPTAHMAYPDGDIRGGSCPSSHPKRLPHLFIENFFNLDSVADKVKADSFTLAQGDNTGFGSHADFFNGWEDGALPNLLSTCTQPEFGNEDVGTCSNFKSSGSASSCSLPVTYKENVDNPGKFLPGCNPVIDTNPVPMMSIAPLGVSTDKCNKDSNGGSGASASGAPASSAPPSGGSASSAPASSGAPASSALAGSSAPGGTYGASSGAAPTRSYPAASTVWATTFATVSSAAASPSAGGGHKHHHKHGHGHAWPSWGAGRR